MTDKTDAPPWRAEMLELLSGMERTAVEEGIAPAATRRFLEGIADLCSPDEPTAASCIDQLRGLEQTSSTWKVVYRRHLLLPLLYLEIVTSRFTPAEIREIDLSGGQKGLWLSSLASALGEHRMREVLLATIVGHRFRVEADWRHALFLVRSSARWLDVPWVREPLIVVMDRMQRGVATDEEQAEYELLTEPLIVDGTTRLRKRRGGKRSASPRDMYLSERLKEIGLPALIEECKAVFGVEDRKEPSVRRRVRAFKGSSPVWVDVPLDFYETALGRCLRPLAPPPIQDAPYVVDRLAAGDRQDSDDDGQEE